MIRGHSRAIGGAVLALLLVGVVGLGLALGSSGAAGPSRDRPEPRPKDTHLVRELSALRTANSDTFLQADGSRVLKIYGHPVNYRAAGGGWTPIKDTLAPVGGGRWSPAAAGVPISLPASLGSGPVLVGAGADRLSFSLQGAGRGVGRAQGTRRAYADTLPGVSVSYSASSDGVRELLSLSGPSAPTVYRYSLGYGSSLHPGLTPTGGVVLRDGSGRIVYTLAPPTVADSSSPRRPAASAPVHYELSNDGSVLSLAIDSRWLHNPRRVFPVKIDPNVSLTEASDCAIVSQGYANAPLCGERLFVGADTATPKDVGRALLRFDLSSIPRNAAILRTRLALWFEAHTSESPIEIEAHALTREFTSEVTWNSFDGSSSWSTPGGDYSSFSDGETKVQAAAVGGWVSWGFTPQVEQWVREPSSNHGILLKAHDETVAGYDTFDQTDNVEEKPIPEMEVIYEPHMGTLAGQMIVGRLTGTQDVFNVNVSNGNLNVTSPDLQYQGKGYETVLGRSYNSQDDNLADTSFGPGWRQNMGSDTLLYETSWDGSYFFHQGDGSTIRFDRAPWADGYPSAGDLAFSGEAEVPATLVVHKDGTRTLTYDDTGIEWWFDVYGFPQQIVDPGGEGNTISLSYTESRLTSVSDTHGHALTLTREPSTTYVTQIKDAYGDQWKYGYTEGMLTSYKAGGEEVKYGYYKDGMLEDIVRPFEIYAFAYDEDGRVTLIRGVVNGTIEKVGSEDRITSFSYGAGSTFVKTPEGTEETYYYEPSGKMKENPETQEAASEFYADSVGIGSSTAKADVGLQDRAAPLDSQLYEQMKDQYVGEWFDPSSGHVVLGIAKGVSEEGVYRDLQKLGLEGQAKIVTEPANWRQLTNAQASLDSSLESQEKAGLVSTGIEPSADAVSIKEANTLTSVEKAKVIGEAEKAGVPTAIKEEAVSNLYGEADSCDHGVCNAPLRGGVSIDHSEETQAAYCTAGFIAKLIYANLPFVLTAGHCIWDAGLGSIWSSSEPGDREKVEGHEYYRYGNRQVGLASSYVYGKHHSNEVTSEGDAGLIYVTGGSWVGDFLPDLVDWGHADLYPILGTEYNPESRQQGFIVCTSGTPGRTPEKEVEFYNPSGKEYPIPTDRCGTISKPHANKVYQQGKETLEVRGLVEVNLCDKKVTSGIIPGASGSPVFKDGLAYGVVSAGQAPNGCNGFYEGINNAEYALHVHVLTQIMYFTDLS